MSHDARIQNGNNNVVNKIKNNEVKSTAKKHCKFTIFKNLE